MNDNNAMGNDPPWQKMVPPTGPTAAQLQRALELAMDHARMSAHQSLTLSDEVIDTAREFLAFLCGESP